MYYKIPGRVAEELGLASTLIRHPDGGYLAPRAVMSRINPDIDRALEISGGIALTMQQAVEDQKGLRHYPLPEDAKAGDTEEPEAAPDTDSEPEEGAAE